MTARYAIYYAPPPGSLLWQAGCQWLGRDPATEEVLEQPEVVGWAAADVHRITASARMYGLHATLKPPFQLADGQGETALQQAVEAFAARTQSVCGLQLELAPLSGFLALQPAVPHTQLMQFAAECVRHFDRFRRPAEPKELAQRRSAGLNPRQDALLLQFGYPYVLDQFRFHVTLTDRLAPDELERLRPWLEQYFSEALREPLTVSDICLFVQPAREAAFRLVRRYPLQAT
jgi:putative phosphonate metabolism protein